jgi:hypothetical protein
MTDSQRSFVPLDLGRCLSSVVLDLEERLRVKKRKPADWELSSSNVRSDAASVDDVSRACDGALSGLNDCTAVFHVTCGIQRGLHRALIGGGPQLNRPYMLCEGHTRAATMLVYSRVGVELPAACRSYFFSAAVTGKHGSARPFHSSPSTADWYSALQDEFVITAPEAASSGVAGNVVSAENVVRKSSGGDHVTAVSQAAGGALQLVPSAPLSESSVSASGMASEESAVLLELSSHAHLDYPDMVALLPQLSRSIIRAQVGGQPPLLRSRHCYPHPRISPWPTL